jgi:hypothetical protein
MQQPPRPRLRRGTLTPSSCGGASFTDSYCTKQAYRSRVSNECIHSPPVPITSTSKSCETTCKSKAKETARGQHPSACEPLAANSSRHPPYPVAIFFPRTNLVSQQAKKPVPLASHYYGTTTTTVPPVSPNCRFAPENPRLVIRASSGCPWGSAHPSRTRPLPGSRLSRDRVIGLVCSRTWPDLRAFSHTSSRADS